jgi:hypothetical protein
MSSTYMLSPAPSSKLLNLTGFFSGTAGFVIASDIVGEDCRYWALTKGSECFVAKVFQELR